MALTLSKSARARPVHRAAAAPPAVVYLAGPDVFRPDAAAHLQQLEVLCTRHGLRGLVPAEGMAVPVHFTVRERGQAVYRENIRRLASADAVLANASAFRGCEPDSGTAFELGYAVARDIPVALYLDQLEPLLDRVHRQYGVRQDAQGRTWDSQAGWLVEDFGLPLNLMLACSALIMADSAEAAVAALAQHLQQRRSVVRTAGV